MLEEIRKQGADADKKDDADGEPVQGVISFK
jgi:hypothetical protein